MLYFDDLVFLAAMIDIVYADPFDCRFPDIYSVQLLTKGSMYFGRDGGGTVVLVAPAIYWIDPRHTYQLGGIDGKDIRHAVNFRGARGRRLLLQGFDKLTVAGWMAVSRSDELERVLRDVAQLTAEPTSLRQAEAVMLMERMLTLLATESASRLRDEPHRKAVERAAREIRTYPFRRHDFPEMASRFHLSYSHFRRLFKEYFHRSPHNYVLHSRMHAAGRELRKRGVGGKQVKEVAILAGYEDPAEFSRAFRKYMGVSPTQFRSALG